MSGLPRSPALQLLRDQLAPPSLAEIGIGVVGTDAIERRPDAFGDNILFVSPTGSIAASGETRAEATTLANALAIAAPGATIIFASGEYRETGSRAITKSLTLAADTGATPWILGTDLIDSGAWSTATAADGSTVWYVPWATKWDFFGDARELDPAVPEAGQLDLVYRDDIEVQQVIDNPFTRGYDGVVDDPNTSAIEGPTAADARWFADGRFWIGTAEINGTAGQFLVIADDPTGAEIEASARRHGLIVRDNVGPIDVTIQGIGMARNAESGLFSPGTNTNLTLLDNSFAENGQIGARARGGEHIARNQFVANGEAGLNVPGAADASGLVLENNYAAYNNIAGFTATWAAAGIKVGFNQNPIVRNNVIEHNDSTGLWMDVSNYGSVIVGNVVRDNGIGIYNEVGGSAVIAFNTSYDNTQGITITDTNDNQLYNNSLYSNFQNLFFRDSFRVNLDTAETYYVTEAADVNERDMFWVTHGAIAKNNLLSAAERFQLNAGELFIGAQDPLGPDNGPLPLNHMATGSVSMFWSANRDGTFTPVDRAVDYNLYHATPTGTFPVGTENRQAGAVRWDVPNATDPDVTWSTADLTAATGFEQAAINVDGSVPLFRDAAAGDFRLTPESASFDNPATGDATALPFEVWAAGRAAGIAGLAEEWTPENGGWGRLSFHGAEAPTGPLVVRIAADGVAQSYRQAAGGSTLFVVADGEVGDETILGFGADDLLVTAQPIFDVNRDGIIKVKRDGTFEVDRTGPRPTQQGADQLTLLDEAGESLAALRYLGASEGEHFYADAATRENLDRAFRRYRVIEDTLGDDHVAAKRGHVLIFQDNALGLDFGDDTITNFSVDDLLVTTRRLADEDDDGVIAYAAAGGIELEYRGERLIEGSTYHLYGLEEEAGRGLRASWAGMFDEGSALMGAFVAELPATPGIMLDVVPLI